MNNELKWLPTSVEKIKNSFKFESSNVLKKNLAYNIQYLQFLHKNILEQKTTTVLYKIRYKMFIINCMAVIEAVFIALLDERNLIPVEEWKDGDHHHRKVNDNLIEIYYNRHRVAPYKKKIKFDEAINLIEKNKVLDITTASFPVIKEIQNLRNHLHLDKAKSSYDTDYNKFDEKQFFAIKLVFYYVMSDKNISLNTDYIEFLHPKMSEFKKHFPNEKI